MFHTIDILHEVTPNASEGMLGAVLKHNSDARPHEVANEYIAGRLGMMMGLPVPAGEIVESAEGPMYVALLFGQGRPPPVSDKDALDLAVHEPRLLSGAVVFDAWVDNGDRFAGNLAYSRDRNIPLALFDNGAALFGDSGEPPLAERMDRPTQETQLTRVATDGHGFDEWVRRASRIDRAMIRSIAQRAVGAGAMSREEGKQVVEMLLLRQASLWQVLRRSDALAHVDSWPLVGG